MSTATPPSSPPRLSSSVLGKRILLSPTPTTPRDAAVQPTNNTTEKKEKRKEEGRVRGRLERAIKAVLDLHHAPHRSASNPADDIRRLIERDADGYLALYADVETCVATLRRYALEDSKHACSYNLFLSRSAVAQMQPDSPLARRRHSEYAIPLLRIVCARLRASDEEDEKGRFTLLAYMAAQWLEVDAGSGEFFDIGSGIYDICHRTPAEWDWLQAISYAEAVFYSFTRHAEAVSILSSAAHKSVPPSSSKKKKARR